MHCENCGALISDKDRFCPNCGKPIDREPSVSADGVIDMGGIDKDAAAAAESMNRDAEGAVAGAGNMSGAAEGAVAGDGNMSGEAEGAVAGDGNMSGASEGAAAGAGSMSGEAEGAVAGAENMNGVAEGASNEAGNVNDSAGDQPKGFYYQNNFEGQSAGFDNMNNANGQGAGFDYQNGPSGQASGFNPQGGQYQVPPNQGPFMPLRTDRSLLMFVLLSIVTCGIYYYIFIYQLAQDVNTACSGDGDDTPGLLIFLLLSIVTCGIYSYIWFFKLGERLSNNLMRYGMPASNGGIEVLLWMLLGQFLCGVGPFIAWYIIINNTNQVCGGYNRTYGFMG
ncbi:MAG: DUF4234 domain-containing protein [Butyrivibrio sp.]|nr:DUF4234 domain-containing protein [Butyrivibrio sp.]